MRFWDDLYGANQNRHSFANDISSIVMPFAELTRKSHIFLGYKYKAVFQELKQSVTTALTNFIRLVHKFQVMISIRLYFIILIG